MAAATGSALPDRCEGLDRLDRRRALSRPRSAARAYGYRCGVRAWSSGPRNSRSEEVEQREDDHEPDQEEDERGCVGAQRPEACRRHPAWGERAGERENEQDRHEPTERHHHAAGDVREGDSVRADVATLTGTNNVPSAASLTSRAPSFLPRYSGVRPTISPAMNTASTTSSSIPNRPEPGPPKITSPVMMFDIATALPSPVNASTPLFTAPSPLAVPAATNSADPAVPKRCSLSCRLAPCSPAACIAGVPWASAAYRTPTPATNSTSMAEYSAQPWRVRPTMRPKVFVIAAGISSISRASTTLARPVGFSNGCAELVLKNPPPSPDRSLIASCDPTGPMAIV